MQYTNEIKKAAVDVLETVGLLFYAAPEIHHKGWFAADSAGYAANSQSSSACKWCSIGGIQAATATLSPFLDSYKVVLYCRSQLDLHPEVKKRRGVYYESCIPAYNDLESTTPLDVSRVFLETAEKIRAELGEQYA